MSVYKDVEKVKFSACMIAVIMAARLVVIVGNALIKNEHGVSNTLTESIVILVLVGLIILGIRKQGNVKFSQSVTI